MATVVKKSLVTLIVLSHILSMTASAQHQGLNHIVTRTYFSENGTKYQDGVAYYNGLGLPMETVEKNCTPEGNSIATYTQYDSLGRSSRQYVPVTLYDGDIFLEPSLFHNYAILQHEDGIPYSKIEYEQSALSRSTSNSGSGQDWQGHDTRKSYLLCKRTNPFLSCKRYKVNEMSGAPVCEGYFPDGSIQVTMTISPDNDTSLVFTDSRGLGILSRQICDGQSLDTYSVYDEFGDLRFVLQPMYQQDSSLVHYSFEYRYDSMDRLTYYRIPGATSSAPVTRYWYDCGGHLTFTQDSRQRSSTVESFTFMLYDFMGREVLSGECSAADTSGIKQHSYIADYTGGEQGTICETGYTVGQMQQPFSNAELHKATYYDKYSFLCRTGFSNRDVFPLASISAAGLPAGEISVVTGDPFTTGYGTRLFRAFYYDAKGRVQKTVSSNIKGGYQIENTSWSFSDKPIQESITVSGNGITSLTETLTYTYDGADRLTSMIHKIGDAIPETILERTYDEKGRIETEQFGGLVATKRQYDYNIRNQLTGIGSFRFSQNLYYCDLFLIGGDHQRRYGPDPSAMTWSAGSGAAGNVVRGYDFRYDHAGRLKSSIYSEGWTNNVGAYNETVNSYDLNGNIGSFSRTGQNTFFNSEGNRIISRNTFSALRTDYTYDRNGNLKSDANKGINNIEYTWQNLPCRITFSNGTTICYLYSADGEKLKENSVFYLGNKIYDSNTLRMIRTDTGYVTLSGSTPTYHYYQRDSQGGNRVVMLSDGTVEQVNTWFPSGYPIGALSTSASLQAFKYSGKEYDTVRDLNLYDFGTRMYDPENRVWNSPDPLAGKYASNSPYAFCADNPMRFVDVDGKDIYYVDKDGRFVQSEADTETDYIFYNGDGEEDYNQMIHFPYGQLEFHYDKSGGNLQVAGPSRNVFALFEFLTKFCEVEFGILGNVNYALIVTDNLTRCIRLHNIYTHVSTKSNVKYVIHSHPKETISSRIKNDTQGDLIAVMGNGTNTLNGIYCSSDKTVILFDKSGYYPIAWSLDCFLHENQIREALNYINTNHSKKLSDLP